MNSITVRSLKEELLKIADVQYTQGKVGDPRLRAIGWFVGADEGGDYDQISKEQQQYLQKHKSLQQARRAYQEKYPDRYNTVASLMLRAPEKVGPAPGMLKNLITFGRAKKQHSEDSAQYQKRLAMYSQPGPPAVVLHAGPTGSPEQAKFYSSIAGDGLY